MIQLNHFYPLTEQLAFIPICVFAIAITRLKHPALFYDFRLFGVEISG